MTLQNKHPMHLVIFSNAVIQGFLKCKTLLFQEVRLGDGVNL